MQHDLVGALKDLMHSQVTEEALDRVVLQIAVATVHLQTVIDDVEALVSGELLGHSAVHRIVWVLRLDQFGTMTHHQTRGFKVCSHPSQLKLQVLVDGDWLAKLLPTLNVLCGGLDASSCTSKRTACNIQTSAIKTRQGDLEAFATLAKQVLLWHLYVVKVNNTGWLDIPSELVLICTE